MNKIKWNFKANNKSLVCALTLLFSAAPAFAVMDNFIVLPKTVFGTPWQPVISLGAGAAFTDNLGSNNYFPVVNPDTDSFYYYQPNQSSTGAGLFDVFLGGEFTLTNEIAVQAGLGYDVATSYNVNGRLTQGADAPSENVYSYHYQVFNQQLQAEGKLMYKFREIYHPYALLGLGAAFNSSYGFTTSVPPFLTLTRDFKNHLETAFTYTVGLGIDVDVAENIRLGLGYRFADLCNVNLGHSTVNTTSVAGSINQSHLYLNQVLAQVTYHGF